MLTKFGCKLWNKWMFLWQANRLMKSPISQLSLTSPQRSTLKHPVPNNTNKQAVLTGATETTLCCLLCDSERRIASDRRVSEGDYTRLNLILLWLDGDMSWTRAAYKRQQPPFLYSLKDLHRKKIDEVSVRDNTAEKYHPFGYENKQRLFQHTALTDWFL
jgi:hypothetical protein